MLITFFSKFSFKRYVFFSIFLTFLFTYGCAQLDIAPKTTDPLDNAGAGNANENAIEYRKSARDNDTLGLQGLFGGKSSASINVDEATFNVILDKLSFMPLASVDSASGIVITDWYAIDENELRIKINVRLLDDQLSNESVSVQMFTQRFDGTKWVDQGLDNEKANKIKESILTEARALKTAIDLS